MGRHGTIAGRKAAQDSKRAAMFTKYARAIIVAAKAGGDPDYNPTLRVAIEKAKGIGSPHTPKNHIWPIALSMQGLTSNDKEEMLSLIRTLSETDAETGFMHESFHKDKPEKFPRVWFSWANTLFAELIIKYLSEGGEI